MESSATFVLIMLETERNLLLKLAFKMHFIDLTVKEIV